MIAGCCRLDRTAGIPDAGASSPSTAPHRDLMRPDLLRVVRVAPRRCRRPDRRVGDHQAAACSRHPPSRSRAGSGVPARVHPAAGQQPPPMQMSDRSAGAPPDLCVTISSSSSGTAGARCARPGRSCAEPAARPECRRVGRMSAGTVLGAEPQLRLSPSISVCTERMSVNGGAPHLDRVESCLVCSVPASFCTRWVACRWSSSSPVARHQRTRRPGSFASVLQHAASSSTASPAGLPSRNQRGPPPWRCALLGLLEAQAYHGAADPRTTTVGPAPTQRLRQRRVPWRTRASRTHIGPFQNTVRASPAGANSWGVRADSTRSVGRILSPHTSARASSNAVAATTSTVSTTPRRAPARTQVSAHGVELVDSSRLVPPSWPCRQM